MKPKRKKLRWSGMRWALRRETGFFAIFNTPWYASRKRASDLYSKDAEEKVVRVRVTVEEV